jgi:tetratricopeptide (TPR) repeat protein
MTKLAQFTEFRRGREPEMHARGEAPRLRTRYYAFLSYSHKDKELADWLHRELEKFRVPSALAGKLTANGVVPRRLSPIFRDQHDLSAGGDLTVEIEAALAASQFLIVLCSPTAAKSHWTNLEIESFKRTRPEGCVLAAVVAGEPFASDIRGREDEECFPPALRYKYDRRGHRTAKRADPLAADFRGGGENNRTALLKLIAGMLGVGLDELVQRDTVRRQRRLAYLAAASLAGMAVTSGLAITAIQARDQAREQRREAEGLIGFMLGDLKDKLEPIGRLDALDGVGSRVLAYYQQEGTSDLSDAALSQRSRALSLMAQVATARGDTDGALRLYREAMAGTGEEVARQPDNPEPLFEHAQNIFYIGEIAHKRGDFQTAERFMREYQRLALRMVALQPDSMKYRMEKQYSEFNLGILLWDQRRFAEAAAQFRDALGTIEAIAAADPGNVDYQQSVADCLPWLGDADRAIGDYRGAVDARVRHVALLEQLFAKSGDVSDEMKLVDAKRGLARYYAEQGRTDEAVAELRLAVAEAAILIPKEPQNAQWVQSGYVAQLALARQLLVSGKADEAAVQSADACASAQRLLRRNTRNTDWRLGWGNCLAVQAQIALARGDAKTALQRAQSALALIKSTHTADAAADAYRTSAAYQQVGDAERKLGDSASAAAAWQSAFAMLPSGVAETPSELNQRAELLQRLGRSAEAIQLMSRLSALGYRSTST